MRLRSGKSSGEASESGSACLLVPLILREVLQHISNTELVTFSLVNKQWNYEARCVMRDRGSLIARLNTAKPCRNLEAFLSDLRQMNVVPFAGIRLEVITVDWEARYRDECNESWLASSTQVLNSIQNLGFNRLSCKYFHVIIHDSWGELCQSSLALMFVGKVLSDYGETLEEFVISPQSKLTDTLDQILQDRSFPSLKTFTFKGYYGQPGDEDNFRVIKTVVSTSPNLQEIRTLWTRELENLLKGRSVVVAPYNSFHAFLRDYSESFIPQLQLKDINMDDIDNWSVEKFHRIVPQLLRTSRTVLQSLTINPVSALPLMCYGIYLENVTKLKIDIGWKRPSDLLHPRVVQLLKAFDFTRIFPKLNKVTARRSHGEARPDHIREFMEQATAAGLKKPLLPDRAANVKDLSLYEDCLIEDNTATFFAELFPTIERLSVNVSQELEASCGFIWEHWKGLQKLEITFERKKLKPLANLDSIFCGIFPEEVAELRQKDDEYLKCVNIVPVMPSFTCLTDLRKFVFVFLDDWDSRDGRRKNPKFLFSRVAGWVAFARSPALSVTIEYSHLLLRTRALSHMKPFASVVPIDYKTRSFVPD